jgi:hypothetical protein
MTPALESLKTKIASSASATALDSVLTTEERTLLGQGHSLLSPNPWVRTGESVYYGADHKGVVRPCPLPPAGFDVYGLHDVGDLQILQKLLADERWIETHA